MVQAKTIW